MKPISVSCLAMLATVLVSGAGLAAVPADSGSPKAVAEEPVYVAYAGPPRPDEEISRLQLGEIDYLNVDYKVLKRGECGEVRLLPGSHFVEWGRGFAGSNWSLGDTVVFEAGHVYWADADRTHPLGLGYQYWFWIEDLTTSFVIAGEKTPGRRTAEQSRLVGFRSEAQRDFIQNVRKGNITAVRADLLRATDPNWPDLSRRTPLMHACARKQLEVAKLLLERGADVNARDMDGKTALHFTAAEGRSADTVRLLLEHGADVNAVDRFGFTPADYWTGKVLREAGGVSGSKIHHY